MAGLSDLGAGGHNGHLPDRLGEIIETSTTRLWVESDRLNLLPPLGSVVVARNEAGQSIYCVVSFGETAGIDTTRRAIRRGSNSVRDQDVYREHPELRQILRTTFVALPVAYRDGASLRYGLPPLPPPLHYSMVEVSSIELDQLVARLGYLSTLSEIATDVPSDALIVAHVRWVYQVRGSDRDWLEQAARSVARLFKSDYERAVPILEGIDPDR